MEHNKKETSDSRKEWKKDMMMYNAFADSDEDDQQQFKKKKETGVFKKKKGAVQRILDSESEEEDFGLVKYKSGILGGRKGFSPEEEDEEREGLIIYNAFAEENPEWKNRVGEPGYKGPQHKGSHHSIQNNY